MKLVLSIIFLLSMTVNAGELPSEISTFELEEGVTILTNSEGLSLYTFDLDDEGVSNCHETCLRIWPVISTDTEGLAEPFGIHVRPDETRQITLDGAPLYTFFRDEKAGDIKGDGFRGTWHLVPFGVK